MTFAINLVDLGNAKALLDEGGDLLREHGDEPRADRCDSCLAMLDMLDGRTLDACEAQELAVALATAAGAFRCEGRVRPNAIDDRAGLADDMVARLAAQVPAAAGAVK